VTSPIEIEQAKQRLIDLYPDSEDIDDAIKIAEEAHQEQKRKSGEPFVLHPLAVAEILGKEGLSETAAVAGLLHDVLEDTDYPPEKIKERFGDEVYSLIEAVTKIVQLAPRGSRQRKTTATYRKLLLAAADDARVLVIKLADRLHNIRTLQALAQTRKRAIAQETLDIYAPLAHRLGMAKIKEELEDRSLAVLDPKSYEEATLVQEERQAASAPMLEKLTEQLNEKLKEINIDANVKSRVKSKYSISEKLRRSGGDKEGIWDVTGLRVIVSNREQCYQVLGAVHTLWRPRFDRFRDFIGVPKANLYQSLHTTVVTDEGQPVEVQIRTAEMNEIAEHGIAAHWLYKETLRQGGPQATRRYLERAAENQRDAEEDSLDEAFAALKRDVFADEIYVFTPQGDVKLLPEGACAIDFAYAVHSELGDRCVGARVDGKLVPLTRKLVAGEAVEIIAGREDNPSLGWLEVAVTARARQRIRAFHAAEIDKEKADEGLRRISDALQSAGLAPLGNRDELRQALEKAGYDDADQAGIEALRDKGRVRIIVEKLVRNLAQADPDPDREETLPTKPQAKDKEEYGVEVDGIEGVKVRLAGCCNPEPGDPIIAYVSLTRGASIHHRDCPEIVVYQKQDSPRLLSAHWASTAQTSFKTHLSLSFYDQGQLLHRIADAIYSVGAELSELNMRSNGRVVRGEAICLATSPQQSEEIRLALSRVAGAIQVRRRMMIEDNQPQRRVSTKELRESSG
jgi:GTP diphosphokinase / guanosine-3',5'-bis(diphosphate) 3'-diphosphatase